MALAQEPLSLHELYLLGTLGAGASNSGGEKDAAVEEAIESLGSLFPVAADGLVRPFHKSVSGTEALYVDVANS